MIPHSVSQNLKYRICGDPTFRFSKSNSINSQISDLWGSTIYFLEFARDEDTWPLCEGIGPEWEGIDDVVLQLIEIGTDPLRVDNPCAAARRFQIFIPKLFGVIGSNPSVQGCVVVVMVPGGRIRVNVWGHCDKRLVMNEIQIINKKHRPLRREHAWREKISYFSVFCFGSSYTMGASDGNLGSQISRREMTH